MKLSQKQVSEYDKKGWILLPEMFSKQEVLVLENAAIDVL